jgi:hypothetical protein
MTPAEVRELATPPTIMVSLRREIVERLMPGVIHNAETLAQSFTDESERRSWITGHIGAHLEAWLNGRGE